jgi:hypothetical protein
MAETLDYIQSLQEEIRKAHGCDSKHIASEFVEGVFRGEMVWMGTVEVFGLVGHPKASLCYAWGHAPHDTGNEVRIVTVLGVPPVDSPRKAVQVSIVADAKAGKAQK